MKKRTWKRIFFMVVCLAFTVSGCTDALRTVDLSGTIPLYPDKLDWAYRSIAHTDVNRSKLNPDQHLADYRGLLNLDKSVTIGKNEYLFVTRFTTGFPIMDLFIDDADSVKGFQSLVYSYQTHRLLPVFSTKQSETGDSWDSRIGLDYRDDRGKRIVKREGLYQAVFLEPSTQEDCLIQSCYSLTSTDTIKEDRGGKSHINENHPPIYESIDLSGTSELKIGLRNCLSGTENVQGEKIRFIVLDWDLDGKFTEADRVFCDYSEKSYGFGERIRLTHSLLAKKDNTYMIHLERDHQSESYRLKIELETKGKP